MDSHPLPPFGGSPAAELMMQPMEHFRAHVFDSHASSSSKSESEADRDMEITTLARTLSQTSQQDCTPTDKPSGSINTFLDTSDPELDPHSGQFKSRKWVKNMLQITCHDPDRYPRRTAGVSFRSLNVFGYGTAADYQTTFANFWLKGIGWTRCIFGLEKRLRIEILRDFDGIVHSGEMLVVLGRPGRYVI